MIRNNKPGSCTSAIFDGNKIEINKACEYIVTKNPNKQIFYFDYPRLFMINIQNFTLQCKHQTSVIPGCQICIYTLPVNCSVKHRKFFVTERIPKLTDFGGDGSNTTTYPINLALVQKFMSESELEQYEGNTFSNIPPIVKLPKLNFFST